MGVDNPHPDVFSETAQRRECSSDWDDAVKDPFDAREIFDLVRGIRDPEHPLTLEQLSVVSGKKKALYNHVKAIIVLGSFRAKLNGLSCKDTSFLVGWLIPQ